jgi:hypothetical protein
MMSADYFLLFFLLFVASGLFLWLLGAAAFDWRPGADSVFRATWLGYALLVGLLQITHLLFPIHKQFAIAIVAGTAFVAVCKLLFGGILRGWTRKSTVAVIASTALLFGISFITFVPVFNGCTKSMCHIDLGVYYLKLIRWTQSFPIVPGLVNLQEQLAFNQNAFLLTSLFDSLVPNRWGIFLIAGFLPWLGLSLSVFAIARLLLMRFRKRESAQAIEIAYAISLPVWISTLANVSMSSASPDCVISCLSIHFFLVFACYVVSDDGREKVRSLGEVLLLGVLCVTVKSSSLGLVIGVFAVSITLLFIERRGEAPRMFLERRVAATSLLAVVFLATWMGRGIILSGYPLFPSTALAMPVRMPTKGIIEFQREIVRWARDPDAGSDPKKILKTWRWFPGWCERVLAMKTQFAWPAQIGVAGSAVLVAFALCGSSLRRNARSVLLLAIPLTIYSIFWFITAPDPRYFGSTMWIFAVCPALTFTASGLRIGLASTLACLGAAAIPIFFSRGSSVGHGPTRKNAFPNSQ